MTLLRELPESNKNRFIDLSIENQYSIRKTFLDVSNRALVFLTTLLMLGLALDSLLIHDRAAMTLELSISLRCFLCGLVSVGFVHVINFEASRVVLLKATNRLRRIFRSELPVEAADTPAINMRWMYATSGLAYLAFFLWIVGAVTTYAAVTSPKLTPSVQLGVSEQTQDHSDKTPTNSQQQSVISLPAPQDQRRWSTSDTVAAVSGSVAFLQFLALVATFAVMRGTARRQLRAYTSPFSVSLFDGSTLTPPNPQRQNEPGVVLEIRNFGQTPAYRMVSWGHIEVIEPINEDKLIVPPLAQVSAQTLPPGGASTKTLWFSRTLTPSEITDIHQGIRLIYYHGRIEYYDVFGKHRYTNFRVAYKGVYPPVGIPVMTFSNEGNESN